MPKIYSLLLLLLLLLLPAAAIAAAGHVADVLQDQRVNGYHSPAAAIKQLQLAGPPSANAPLDLRRRYYAALGRLALPADDASLRLTSLARLEVMADRDNCKPCRIDALLLRADSARFRGDSTAAQLYVASVRPLIVDDDLDSRVRLGIIEARVQHAEGNLADAVEYAVPALSLAEQSGNRAAQIHLMILLTSVNADLGHIEQATEITEAGLALAQSMGFSDGLGFLRLNQGHIYSITGQRSEQLEALTAALAITNGDHGLARIEVTTLSNLADYYLYAGDFEVALDYADRAVKLAGATDESHGLVVATANQGIALSGLGDAAQGIEKLKESVELAEEIGHRGYVVGVTHELVRVLEQAGRYKEALDAMHKVAAINQEITRQEREKAVIDVQEKYASEEKNREIERLSADNKIKQAEVAARAWKQRLWAALALVFALAGVLLVQWLSRSRQLNRRLSDDNASLADESVHDPLTGAFNRRHFHQLMARRAAMPADLANDHALSGPVGLMVLDLDHFKQVNDSYGHDAGDVVLVELVRRLHALLREQDAVVRWGGEEFVLVLPGIARAGLPILAGRVLRAIAGEPIRYDNQPLTVTLSLGCVTHPVGRDVSWEDALRLADAAMYRAKKMGRNRAVCVQGVAGAAPEECEEHIALEGIAPMSVLTIAGPGLGSDLS